MCIWQKNGWAKALESFLISIASNVVVNFIPDMKHNSLKDNKITANDISGNIYQDVRIGKFRNKEEKKNCIKAKSIKGSIYQDSDVISQQVFSYFNDNPRNVLCSGEKTKLKLKK